MWSLCAILTVTNVLEEGHPARTDARLRVLTDSAWFYIPYPGQFGLPTVTVAGELSVGDEEIFQLTTYANGYFLRMKNPFFIFFSRIDFFFMIFPSIIHWICCSFFLPLYSFIFLCMFSLNSEINFLIFFFYKEVLFIISILLFQCFHVRPKGVLGMLAGVLACTVESISYYPTVSQMCEAPPPPLHAINRGIGIEGLGTILAGLWGSGNGTNTFGENVGAIGVTKVRQQINLYRIINMCLDSLSLEFVFPMNFRLYFLCSRYPFFETHFYMTEKKLCYFLFQIGSRRVIQWAALIMILQGVINKFGAIFIMVPDPVVGGLFCVMFGMITAFGLSALQYVDLRSSRNLYIIGISLFFPLVLCQWMQEHPGAINTGVKELDSTLSVLLSTTILVGGILGCLLDNLIPGN